MADTEKVIGWVSGDREPIRITRSTFRGKPYLGFRKMFKPDESTLLDPVDTSKLTDDELTEHYTGFTKQGMNLPFDSEGLAQIDDLIEGLQKARATFDN